MPPLSTSSMSILSLFTHIICYLTGSLHPLVVLTLAILFMVLWIAVTADVAVLYVAGGCAAGFGDCTTNAGVLVLTILIT